VLLLQPRVKTKHKLAPPSAGRSQVSPCEDERRNRADENAAWEGMEISYFEAAASGIARRSHRYQCAQRLFGITKRSAS